MAFDFTPVNYSGMLGIASPEQLRALRLQEQQVEMQRQQQAAQMQAAQAKAQQQQEYNLAVRDLIGNPNASAQDYAAFQLRFPDQQEAVSKAFKMKDEATQATDLRDKTRLYGQIQTGIKTGDFTAAKKILQDRITAEKGAGLDTSEDEEALALIDSNPQAALTATGLALAATAGPEKIATIMEQLRLGSAGNVREVGPGVDVVDFDQLGPDGKPKVLYSSQFKPQFVTDPATGAITAITVDNNAGGSKGPTGGFDAIMGEWIFPIEGGFVAKDGKSGAPANYGINQRANPDIDVRNLTPERAKEIYRKRYWEASGADKISDPRLQAIHMDSAVNFGVDVAKGMLAQAKGDPNEYLRLREARYRKIGGSDLEGWLNRNERLRGYVSGGGGGSGFTATPVTGGKAPETKARRMTPEEVQAEGLDPSVVYYRGKDGVPQAVSGQTKQTAARQVPQSVANKIEPQVSIRDALDRLNRTFKNDFGGNKVTGGAENMIQGLVGSFGTPGQRDWWADFQSMDNQIRNDLFGAALTSAEQRAYEQTTVSPRMDPGQIRTNLRRRLEIINGALTRQRNALKANRYDADAVDALFEPLGGGQPAPSGPSQGWGKARRVQ